MWIPDVFDGIWSHQNPFFYLSHLWKARKIPKKGQTTHKKMGQTPKKWGKNSCKMGQKINQNTYFQK